MEKLRYLDFDLRISREGDHYRASVLGSPAGEASISFSLPFSEDKIELLISKLGGHLRRSVRRIDSSEMKTAREFGGKLFESVFTGDIYACLKGSLDEVAREKSTGLRIRMRLQDVPELSDIPWEFLYNPSRDLFLAQSRKTPVVRYIEMQEAIQPLTVELPLHILIMISSPSDYACLDIEHEKDNILEALEPLIREGKVRIKFMPDARLSALRRLLRTESCHIFHFIGHGGFSENIEEGVLVLEDDEGKSYHANAHRISSALQDCESPPRLILLNACEGARASKSDPFASVAATLVRHGIPAVIAMQFEITDGAAITLASEFYTALAEGFPVDAALAEARNAIYLKPNDVEWGTPVLYMRSPDGALFHLAEKLSGPEKPPVPEKPEPVVEHPRPQPAQEEKSASHTAGAKKEKSSAVAAGLPEKAKVEKPAAGDKAVKQTIPPEEKKSPQIVQPPKPSFFKAHWGKLLILFIIVIFLAYVIDELDKPKPPKPVSVVPDRQDHAGDSRNIESIYQTAVTLAAQNNYAEAANLYRKAAELGHPGAQNNLGYFYQHGFGVPVDYSEALRWYRMAAARGNPVAYGNLAFMYQHGVGVPQNYPEAIRLYRIAAAQGNMAAQTELRKMGLNW